MKSGGRNKGRGAPSTHYCPSQNHFPFCTASPGTSLRHHPPLAVKPDVDQFVSLKNYCIFSKLLILNSCQPGNLLTNFTFNELDNRLLANNMHWTQETSNFMFLALSITRVLNHGDSQLLKGLALMERLHRQRSLLSN